ncbi:MAG TPA: hypothetical protein VK914_00940 [bacterium]|jgi:hypothetical protein|nr:hypothetical protein [bacterium]
MSRFSKFSTLLLALGLFTAASVAFAFPFWLSSPSRSNANDPLSPNYKKVATSPTATFTSTDSPTPSQTPTAGPGPLLADFENNAPANNGGADDNWQEPIVTGFGDSAGSNPSPATSLSPFPWGAGSQAAGNGPSLPGANSGCITGTIAAQSGSPTDYPYAYIALDVTPSGNTGNSGDVADIGPYDPNNGIQFDYMGTVGVSYVVQIIAPLTAANCGNYYQFQFTPPNSGWNTVDVYFPGVNTIGNLFTQPNYGCSPPTTTWSTSIGAVQFKVVASTTQSQAYNLCVDNVTFSPPPAPTPVVISSVVFNGEQSVNYTDDLWNQNIEIACSPSSTIYPPSFQGTPSSAVGVDPNFPASTYYARVTGTVGDQTGCTPGPSCTDPYPYAYMSFDLAQGGTSGTNFANCLPYSPNDGFQFDYRAGTACVTYEVELISANINGSTEAFWQYTWTPPDTNWHTVDVYFPASSTWYTPQAGWTPPSGVNVLFEPTYVTDVAFDPTQVGAFEFKPVAPINEPAQAYDLSITNLTFAAPVASSGPALDVSGGVNTAGTVISTFEYATSAPAANTELGGGTGPLAASGPDPEVAWQADGGTVLNNSPWSATSQTAANGPTLSGNACMEFSGNVDTGGYAVAEFAFDGSATGNLYGTANPNYPGYNAGQAPGTAYAGNIESLSPNKRFVFDYKNGVNGENEQINVQFCTQAAPNYDFYRYLFTTAGDTNWHTVVIYFPDSPYGPQFTEFPGTCTPWTPSESEMIEIGPTAPGNFDIYLDNLWFD